MFRRILSCEAGHSPLGTAGLGMALALPALAPVVVAVIAVSSVTLSPDTVTAGTTATATVTLDASAPLGTRVLLSSSNPSVATVPLSITIGGKLGNQGGFSVNTVAGSPAARPSRPEVGTTAAKSALLAVQPPISTGLLTLTLSTGSVQGAHP